MQDETKVILFRMGCGTAILIVSAVTQMNSYLQGIALFLLGVPAEYAVAIRKKNEE